MLINETAKFCNLTKKAVEYYTEQGMVNPAILENGYRDFFKAGHRNSKTSCFIMKFFK